MHNFLHILLEKKKDLIEHIFAETNFMVNVHCGGDHESKAKAMYMSTQKVLTEAMEKLNEKIDDRFGELKQDIMQMKTK